MRGPIARLILAIRPAIVALVLITLMAPTVLAADRDRDGLRDGFEARYGVTSPDRQDSDRDGVIDAAEDSDGDRLGNHAEQRFGTNPGKADTDGDGVLDGAEDHDGDGRSNAREQDQRPLPYGVTPALKAAKRDRARGTRNCASPDGSARLVRCADGDTESDVRIVLLGDSHGTMLLDPIRRAGRTAGWRVESMLKGACVPLLGSMNTAQWELDRGRTCREWRIKALDRINADPPDLLIVTGNDNAVFVDNRGRTLKRSGRPAAWRKGMQRLIDRLPAQTTLLALGDVPDTKANPVLCLKADQSDMSRCASRRKPLSQRGIENAIRAVTEANGQHYGTLYGKICSYDPCPLVQGKTLVWRSHGHLSATFARRLMPSLRTIIRSALER